MTRPDVDGKRIVLAGVSRWGHITVLIAAQDERVAMAIAWQTGQVMCVSAIGCGGHPFHNSYTIPYAFFKDRNQAFPVDMYMQIAACITAGRWYALRRSPRRPRDPSGSSAPCAAETTARGRWRQR